MQKFCLVLLLVAIGNVVALAQNATILGTVTDPNGAVIPNATVTITNTDTGLTVSSKRTVLAIIMRRNCRLEPIQLPPKQGALNDTHVPA